MSDLQAFNLDLFFAINNGLKSPIGDVLLGYTTYLGDGMVLYPLALIGLFLLDRKRFWQNFGIVVVAALSPRPLAYFEGAIQRGEVVVNVMFEPLRSRSFPSGHSQSAFTFAHIFAFLVSRTSLKKVQQQYLQISFYLLASLTSLSRVYVGVHFPFDVVAGALIGIFFSQVVIWAIQFYERSSRLNSNLTS
jgi:undecaprenyl-diphosphatase